MSPTKHGDVPQTNVSITKPSIISFDSYRGSQEEAHGHFILACSDGGFLQIGESGYVLERQSTAKIFVESRQKRAAFVED